MFSSCFARDRLIRSLGVARCDSAAKCIEISARRQVRAAHGPRDAANIRATGAVSDPQLTSGLSQVEGRRRPADTRGPGAAQMIGADKFMGKMSANPSSKSWSGRKFAVSRGVDDTATRFHQECYLSQTRRTSRSEDVCPPVELGKTRRLLLLILLFLLLNPIP
ncbi:hypothetical protein VTJ04DRAFT_1865 [Mycothermus thermophilus]|uniref:uncharacterized protein n=1 Tax=Humicola insolens TaxID=85995 RepID=UPI0037437AC9